MNIVVIIPSRLASTRLMQKPLLKITGVSLLERVIRRAKLALEPFPHIKLIVACDDLEIANIAESLNVQTCMTSPNTKTGTDRVFEAAQQLPTQPDYIINLQGDAPFMPISAIRGLILQAEKEFPAYATAVSQLSWAELSELRAHKLESPSSGTTAIVINNKAIWFSKNILPHIRNEQQQMQERKLSPVYRHLGIYGYSYEFLQKFVGWETGYYEKIEALEQLRALEQGYAPEVIILSDIANESYLSIDSPFDISKAEQLLLDNPS